MNNFEDFDMLFEALTQDWETDVKDKCKAEYEEIKKESLNFIEYFNKILSDKSLAEQIENELDKRLRS